MNRIVLKFGGSSQCYTGINVILNKIKKYTDNNNKIFLVVSAVGKTTNNLYEIVNGNMYAYDIIYDTHIKYCKSINVDFDCITELLDELKTDMTEYHGKPFINITQKKLKIISYGEILASTIVHKFLRNNFIDNKFINAHLFMKNRGSINDIDDFTLNTKGEFYCIEKLVNKLIEENDVVITQGFIASTSDNGYCVLTRSGSNTSASLIANAINASRLEIWTDVNGLYTADPRKIKNAKMIPYIRYAACQEAAAMGSQIIHPFSIKPCEAKNIPIHIRNTFNSDLNEYTVINGHEMIKDTYNVHLISYQKDVTVFKIESFDMWEAHGIVYDIFSVFKDEKIDINIITTSQFSVAITTNEKSIEKLERVRFELKKKYDISMITNCGIVSIIADDISHNIYVQNVHSVISESDEPIYITHYGANNLTLSFVINDSYADRLTTKLHDELIK
jgi:aspartate kinase